MSLYICCLIILILLLIYNHYRIPITIGNRTYHVIGLYSDNKKAAQLLDNVNNNMIQLLRHLKRSYANTKVYNIVHSALVNYDPEMQYETISFGGSTSYTVNKTKMYLCLRDTITSKLVDINTAMFVVLHETAHIANHEWGHKEQFWRIFRFLLVEATNIGIYDPIDYSKYPVIYCGITIDYNPYFDHNITSLI